MFLKVRDANTAGAYCVFDNVLPAGSPGPTPHRHQRHDETFYVLEGELRVRVERDVFTASPGSFVIVPRGAVHQPSNPGPQPTRVLLTFSPGGMDGFFEWAARERVPLQNRGGPPASPAQVAVLRERFGYEFAQFPG